jgi:hypothetical protein
VDPITAAALATTVVPLVSGAAGEAGKQAWTSLAAFVRARFGREAASVAAAEALERQPDSAHGEELAARLVRLAEQDSEFSEWLNTWFRDVAPLVDQRSSVVNTVSGQARISGGMVQAHTINGPLIFGAPAPPPPDPR